MNDKPSKELLSAYLDGEVSPSEKPEIERHLGTSAETQQELADYRRISELIQNLPVETAAPEFRAAVLHAAERQMLLPAGDPPDRISGSRSVRLRRRWLVTGGVLASAAMLFLAVRLLDLAGPIPQTGGSRDVAMKDAPAASASGADSLSLDESDRPAESQDNARRTVAAEAATSGRGGYAPTRTKAKQLGAAGSGAPRAPAVAAKKTVAAVAEHNAKTKARWARTFSGGGAGLVFGSNLKNARVGEAVKALERSGDHVTVITLTVVDRRAGLDDLQILLARHQIPKVPGQSREEKSFQRRQQKAKRDLKKHAPAPLAGKSAAGRAPSAAAQPVSGPKKGELVAVYVEATPDQLASVLGELQRRKQFVGLNVGRAIAVTQLDALSHSQVNGRKREHERLSRTAKDASGRQAGIAVAAKPTGVKKGLRKTKTVQRKLNSDADFSRPSRQLRLALPAGSFKAGYRKRWFADKPADDRHADAAASDGKRKNRVSADKKAAARNDKENRPPGKSSVPKRGSGRPQSVQVLFVLVTGHRKSGQPQSRPHPSSTKPAPRKSDSRRPRDGMPG